MQICLEAHSDRQSSPAISNRVRRARSRGCAQKVRIWALTSSPLLPQNLTCTELNRLPNMLSCVRQPSAACKCKKSFRICPAPLTTNSPRGRVCCLSHHCHTHILLPEITLSIKASSLALNGVVFLSHSLSVKHPCYRTQCRSLLLQQP